MNVRGRALRAAALTLMMTFGWAAAAQNPAISVNFVRNDNANNVDDGNVSSLLPSETAGAPGFERSNWNNYARWGNFDTPVKDQLGGLTSVQIAWDSPNTWGTGTSGSPNAKLMDGYIDSSDVANIAVATPYNFYGSTANHPQVYVRGLSAWLAANGAIGYSVVLYSDGDATEGRVAEYWLQSASGTDLGALTVGGDLTSHVFVSDTSNFSGSFTQVPLSADSVGTAGQGNFLVFDNLSADSLLIRTENRDFRALLNGFQIIAVVPEPASLSLAALGAIGLLARRRRGE